MTRPGTRLRELSARVLSPVTMSRLIDPAITDMQTEYDEARRRGHTWLRRWVLIRGYVTFAQVVAQCGPFEIRQAQREWDSDDRACLRRSILIGSLATLLATVLLELTWLPVPLINSEASPIVLAGLLVPAMLPLSVPLGLAIGIAIGLGQREVSRRVVLVILAIAAAASIVGLVNLGGTTPAANQALREEWAHGMGWTGSVSRGTRELSLLELKGARPIRTLPSSINERLFEYHRRLSLAFAPVTFAGFALVMATRRRRSVIVGALSTGAIPGGYMFALWFGQVLTNEGIITPFVGGWLPQIFLVALITAMLAAGLRHQTPSAAPSQEEAPRWQ